MTFLETTPSITDPVATLFQYGIVGMILILLLTGNLWPKPAVEQMMKKQEEERKLWIDQIIPTMNMLSRNLATNNVLLRQVLRSRGITPEEAPDGDN